jgi:HK97 family phage portal protein
MVAVQSLGAMVSVEAGWRPALSYGSVQMYNTYYYSYAQLYREQPNVRTCVDFLARNIAQLGLHVFRRAGETDRVRLRDHPLAQVIERPLPAAFKVTRYSLINALMSDLGIYFNAYWLKVRSGQTQGSAPTMGLLRIPPPYVTVSGGLVLTGYEISVGGQSKKIGPEEIVHFRGYNPETGLSGLAPLETLRRILAEEHSSGDYREHFWANAARMGGIVERPKDAPEWSDTARQRFRSEFEALYSGGPNSGKTAVLEEGMTWKEQTFNAQESEYLAGRKLTREECARAYHIPLPMVGILEHATFSNIREQHKNLYQDCLGPWLAMIEQDIQLQLLGDFEDTKGIYLEFNIAEKLQGAFEEQTTALQAAVGRPWMTANEARARMNLPSMGGDADALVTPLNVLVGGQASPQDSAPGKGEGGKGEKGKRGTIDPTLPTVRARHVEKWREVLAGEFRRQREAVIGKVPGESRMARIGPNRTNEDAVASRKQGVGEIWDVERWNRELQVDLFRLSRASALVWARYVAQQLEAEVNEEGMDAWLDEHSRIQAEYMNGATRDGIAVALTEEDPRAAVEHLFELMIGVRAVQDAMSAVTAASNFGAHEGARAGGLRSKTWQVNSSNPRPEHAAMAGETVGIGELFSNGARWPGDPVLGADGNSNCQCSCVFGTE